MTEISIGSPPPLPQDRFRILREISRPGGQGRLFVVEDSSVEQGRGANGRLRSRRVVKVCRPVHGEVTDTARRRLWREFSLAGAIHDDHVITVFDHQRSALGDYFVMMHYEGARDLSEVLRTRSLALPEAIQLIADAAKGVAAAHRAKIVHRDIKPSNFLVVPAEAGFRVVLIDFGIGESFGEKEGYQALTRLGEGSPMTPRYASPEQRVGRTVGPASDLFSLGVVAYEVLTGRLPFSEQELDAAAEGDPLHPPPLPEGVPAWLSAAVYRLLSPIPGQRGTAETLLKTLKTMRPSPPGPDAVGGGARADSAEKTLTHSSTSKWPRSKRVRRWLAICAAIGGPIGILGVTYDVWKDFFRRSPIELPPRIAVSLKPLWEDVDLGSGCVDVFALRHDLDRSFTSVLVPELNRTLPQDGGLRLRPRWSADLGTAARPDCPWRITGDLLSPPVENRAAEATIHLSRRDEGSSAWLPVKTIRLGSHERGARYPKLFEEMSFDSLPEGHPVGALRSVTGRSDAKYECGEFGRLPAARSAVRKALASVVPPPIGPRHIRVLRQTVREHRYNVFDAHIAYVFTDSGEDPAALLACDGDVS
ncbi:MAG TPA: serine/threonine-protein kinase [Gemmatimonadales bacterium]|nr:serine/threonine-protein kinase [Gemmatimonadales bacterium]